MNALLALLLSVTVNFGGGVIIKDKETQTVTPSAQIGGGIIIGEKKKED